LKHISAYVGLPDHLKLFQGHFVFQRDAVSYFRERLQGGTSVCRGYETGIRLPGNWE